MPTVRQPETPSKRTQLYSMLLIMRGKRSRIWGFCSRDCGTWPWNKRKLEAKILGWCSCASLENCSSIVDLSGISCLCRWLKRSISRDQFPQFG